MYMHMCIDPVHSVCVSTCLFLFPCNFIEHSNSHPGPVINSTTVLL